MKRFALILFASVVALPQVAEHANKGYQTKEGRERMSNVLAGPDRDERQKPKELIAAIRIKPGSTVADLGTGVGYMLPYLSAAVGPSGKVFAADIFSDFLDQARSRAEREKLGNVTFVLGSEKDPKLPEDSVDAVLALDAYHHFNYPAEMLDGIRKALRPGGRLIVVDFYKNGFRDPDHIRLDKADVIREIESNGFNLVSNDEHVPKSQYIAVFEKNP